MACAVVRANAQTAAGEPPPEPTRGHIGAVHWAQIIYCEPHGVRTGALVVLTGGSYCLNAYLSVARIARTVQVHHKAGMSK